MLIFRVLVDYCIDLLNRFGKLVPDSNEFLESSGLATSTMTSSTSST
jgi:hypothetical protein